MAGRHGRDQAPDPEDPLAEDKAEEERLLQRWRATKTDPDATDDERLDAFFRWWKEGG